MSDYKFFPTLKRIIRYFIIFLLGVIVCSLALFLAGLLPQWTIFGNMEKSVELFEREGCYPQITQKRESYQLDNYSDALMISHSYYMNTRESPNAIFSNPGYGNNADPVSSLIEISKTEPGANFWYSHYWMGFRVPLRALLTITDYSHIRITVSWTLLLLFCVAILTLAQRLDKWIALCLAIAVLSCNIIVMATSLQFSCCYILAFCGILAVDRFRERKNFLVVIFLLLGQLTQFFDFYTTPIITYGLPMSVLLLIGLKEGWLRRAKDSFRFAMKCFLAWGLAYAGMWIMRMVLVTIFTQINGFLIVRRFADYAGIINDIIPKTTLMNVLMQAIVVFMSKPTVVVGGISLFIWFMLLVKRRKEINAAGVVRGSIFLVLALLPIAWISASSKAFSIHFWFQYRSLSLTVFGIYCFLYQIVFIRENRDTSVKLL